MSAADFQPSDDQRLENSRLIEAERAAIGHEIHDALLPLIFGASAGLHHLIDRHDREPTGDSDPAAVERREQLEKITKWVDQALQTGRQILGAAYPAELRHRTWSAAAAETLTRILDDAAQRRTVIQWNVSDAAMALPEDVATAAYRITIEAIRNAARHGMATEVRVAANVDDQTLTLVVEDNGVGFDPQDVSSDRFGIRSMKGRAELVGGQLTLAAKPSCPTTVTFRCHVSA
ncbi:sensor signal transduction histidine kinase [Rhodopirellula maiorica SM1]|uniref:histidine kinase n=1 Tax=Rhodopirellula maiorica SM1 TaxID=1265738 RepID=M5RRU6_9BACT|nr:ATP-binding protein [Rhodopirellula maiorica]EMI16684.1 sensor signal transduction histidine kinase [Rhodopirellula maiorica SM1]